MPFDVRKECLRYTDPAGQKMLMESRWYVDDCTGENFDGPSESSSDSISFNGQLVNPIPTIIHPGEKGIVYIGNIDSDDDDKDVDTLESVCKGHGISIYTDPCNVRFDVFLPMVDEQTKRVIYCIMVLRTEMGIDKDKVLVERRYSDFRALYKSLKKDFPTFLKDINFPKRVLGQKSNLDPELIESRRMEFQSFLQTIYQHNEVRQHPAFREFFYLPGLREATECLIGGDLDNSLELLLNSLHLQVKLCDKEREIIATLGAIVVVLEAQDNLEDADHYAMAALDLAQDDYLCSFVIPLLDTAVKLRQKLQMDKKAIESHLIHVQRMTGVNVDHIFSLRALAVMRFHKEKTSS